MTPVPSLLFVVGMPRSGTKLLRDLLNRHPAVAIFPCESHFIPHYHRRFPDYGDITAPENFAKFYRDFTGTTFYRRMSARGLAIEQRCWLDRLAGKEFHHLIEALFYCYADANGSEVRIVGDKTPSYINQVPLLTRLFPKARVVHIVRDPRDYALSIHKAWGKHVLRAVQRWKTQVRQLKQDAIQHQTRLCEVRYEDLLEAPDETMKMLCGYLGLPFDSRMLTLSKPSENIGDTRGQREVVRGNRDKWKQTLSPQSVAAIERIAGRLMSELGYSVTNSIGDSDPGKLRMWLWQCQDGLNLVRSRVGQEGGLLAGVSQTMRELKYRSSQE